MPPLPTPPPLDSLSVVCFYSLSLVPIPIAMIFHFSAVHCATFSRCFVRLLAESTSSDDFFWSLKQKIHPLLSSPSPLPLAPLFCVVVACTFWILVGELTREDAALVLPSCEQKENRRSSEMEKKETKNKPETTHTHTHTHTDDPTREVKGKAKKKSSSGAVRESMSL